MPIVGFGFTKVSAERKDQLKKQDKVQSSVKITSLKETKIKMSEEEKEALILSFDFNIDYSNAGKLELLGNIVYYESPDKINELLTAWEKNKTVPPEFGAMMYNFILGKANIKALQLEEEVGLPLHLRLPQVKVKQN